MMRETADITSGFPPHLSDYHWRCFKCYARDSFKLVGEASGSLRYLCMSCGVIVPFHSPHLARDWLTSVFREHYMDLTHTHKNVTDVECPCCHRVGLELLVAWDVFACKHCKEWITGGISIVHDMPSLALGE